eukprot:3420936-Amphidinium_carterae.1
MARYEGGLEPLAQQFLAFMVEANKVAFITYSRLGENQSAMNKEQIFAQSHIVQAMHRLQSNMAFRKLDTQKALQLALDIDKSEPSFYTRYFAGREDNVLQWAVEIARRLRTMLRDFTQAWLKGRGKTLKWVHLVLKGSLQALLAAIESQPWHLHGICPTDVTSLSTLKLF